MDSGLDQNKSEFAILVGSLLLNMLSHVDGLLDQVVEVLGQRWSHSVDLQNSQNLRSSHALNLRNAVLISQKNANLRWGRASLSQLNHLVSQVLSGNMNPAGWGLSVWKTSSGNTFSLAMHSTHFCL